MVRKTTGLNQVDFGDILGISGGAVSMIESGQRMPSVPVIRTLCREFNISYAWLTTGEEPMYMPQEQLDIAALERIMRGGNETVKSVFRELADMPTEWWEQAVAMLKRIVDKEKDR